MTLSDSLSSNVLLGLFIYLNLTVFCVDAVVSSFVVLWDFYVRSFMFLVLFPLALFPSVFMLSQYYFLDACFLMR